MPLAGPSPAGRPFLPSSAAWPSGGDGLKSDVGWRDSWDHILLGIHLRWRPQSMFAIHSDVRGGMASVRSGIWCASASLAFTGLSLSRATQASVPLHSTQTSFGPSKPMIRETVDHPSWSVLKHTRSPTPYSFEIGALFLSIALRTLEDISTLMNAFLAFSRIFAIFENLPINVPCVVGDVYIYINTYIYIRMYISVYIYTHSYYVVPSFGDFSSEKGRQLGSENIQLVIFLNRQPQSFGSHTRTNRNPRWFLDFFKIFTILTSPS